MGLRDTLRDKPAVGAAVVLVLLAGAGVVLTATRRNASAPPAYSQTWYYDTGTGKLFAAKNQPPPISTATGSEGVRAMVFSCGACEEGQWTIAYLETHTPPAKALLDQPPGKVSIEARGEAMTVGRLVAIPPEPGAKPQWIPSNAMPAAAIVARASLQCPDSNKIPQACTP